MNIFITIVNELFVMDIFKYVNELLINNLSRYIQRC